MGITYSVDKVDKNGRELLTYGTKDFPIAFFDDDLSKVRVPWHWHDELEIIIITTGRVKVKIANSEFSLSAGEGYFANSGILHSADLTSLTGHQHALVFDPKTVAYPGDIIWNTYMAPVIGSPHLPFIRLSPSVKWQKDILRLSDDAWHQGAYEKKDYPINVRELLTKVFSLILGHMEMLKNEPAYTDSFQKDELRIKKALAFIENNYSDPISIEDISGSMNLSVSSCLRVFKAVLCTTPIKYLIKYRLERIADELNHPGERTISEIILSNGFADATYFNRCFKKEFGITPSEYIAEHSLR